jgi:glucose dehydrogenase
MTYKTKSGKQFVVVYAGGGTGANAGVIAYALP